MIKVMTLNINYYGDRYGPWSVRKELVRETVRETSADIVALQAVRRDPAAYFGEDQALQLAGLLPEYAHVLFQPAIENPDGSAEGSAFLSQVPWRETQVRELSHIPGLGDETPRVILAAVFDRPDGELTLFNAHFSWIEPQALSNVNEALLFVNSFSGARLLVGDLNQTPDSAALRPLVDAGWSDAWGSLHPQDRGDTFIEDDLPAKRIDYVWVSPELRGQVQEIQIVGARLHESGARISDHLGLLATLS